MSRHPVLLAEALSRVYSDGEKSITVLNAVNLTVSAAECVAIVGNSGSGKSTLLHLLGGLDSPTTGRVILDGVDLNTANDATKCRLRNHYLGFVYQFHYLLPEFSALENVSLPLLIRGLPLRVIKERAEALLVEVGLKERLSHRLSELSGGERQRVAIARALVGQPLCVLADEPTGNLDPKNADRILELFFHLQATQKTSVVIVTHDLSIAKKADRLLTIEQGHLVSVTPSPT